MKKAELSLTVVVGAAIALLVLIILSFVLFGGSNNFVEGLNSCPGLCARDASVCGSSGYEDFPIAKNTDKCSDQYGESGFDVCCIGLG